MSALPKPDPAPRTRVRRNKRFYHGKTASDVNRSFRESSWTGRMLVPDIGRIAVSKSQILLLWSIYYHTEGKPHNVKNKKWKAPEWTEPMWPQDFAVEIGYSRPAVIEAIEEGVARGVIARRGDSGTECYQFKLLRDAWPKMESTEKPEPSKKEPRSEGIDDEDDVPEAPSAPEPTRVPSGTAVIWSQRGKSGKMATIPVLNRQPSEVVISAQVVNGVEHMVLDQQPSDRHEADSSGDPARNGNGSFDYRSKTTRVSGLTAVPPKKNGFVQPWKFDLADFPISLEAVQGKFAGTEDEWLARVFMQSIGLAIAEGLDPRLVTDDVMYQCLRDCTAKTQEKAGLYEKVLPAAVKAWARRHLAKQRQKPGTGKNPFLVDEEAHLAARRQLWDLVCEVHKTAAQGYDMQAIANDSRLDDAGKQQAERMIERLGRFTKVGL